MAVLDELDARLPISPATTANPFPASPTLAASIEAFKDRRFEMMCNVISVFLMAFVVFYMSYSNRFFLRRRTKELGVYALLGYRKTTVLSLLTTENLLVCFGAFIVGILLGSFFHKGIVFGMA